jgi:hypothetical protein
MSVHPLSLNFKQPLIAIAFSLAMATGLWAETEREIRVSECLNCTPEQLANFLENRIQGVGLEGAKRVNIHLDQNVLSNPWEFLARGSVSHLVIQSSNKSQISFISASSKAAISWEGELEALQFEGVTITMTGGLSGLVSEDAAIRTLAVENVVFENDASMASAAIFLKNFDHVTISESSFLGFHSGAVFWGNGRGQVAFNHNHIIDAESVGLEVRRVATAGIGSNTIRSQQNGSAGILIGGIGNVAVTRNAISVSNRALDVVGETTTQSFTVVNNMFTSVNSASVFFDGVQELNFYHNSCRGIQGLVVESVSHGHFINNIFYGTRSFAIRFFQLPIVLELDYNIYHSESPLLVRMTDHIFSELTVWKAADTTINQHSLQGDPLFYGPTDLHVMGLLAKNVGYNNLGILVDFDGDQRPIPAGQPVDIGADEYELPFLDIHLEDVFILRKACQDSSVSVFIALQNLGTTPVNHGIQINVSLSGVLQTFFQTTYTNYIPAGARDTVLLGTVKLPFGGQVVMSGLLTMTGDQRLFNNSLSGKEVFVMPTYPSVPTEVTICHSDSLASIPAQPNQLALNLWFENALDLLPVYIGDTFEVASSALPASFFAAVLDKRTRIETGWDGVQSSQTNRMRLTLKENILVTGITLIPATSGSIPLEIFIRESGNTNWQPFHAATHMAIADVPLFVELPYKQLFFAGEQVELFVSMPAQFAFRVAYQNQVYFESDEIVLDSAFLDQSPTPNSPEGIFCGTLHYITEICLQNRVEVRIDVQQDSAIAQFTHLSLVGGRVEFDASASFGHRFIWDFGDGNMGTGLKPVHYYRTDGEYLVTLIVVDTICHTTDTFRISVGAFLSLTQNPAGPSIRLFPNPMASVFYIEIENLQGHGDYELMNAPGQVVKRARFDYGNGPIACSVSDLPSGIYFLKVKLKDQPTRIFRVVKSAN